MGADKYQKCPVCEGRGVLPQGFYNVNYIPQSTTLLTPEMCRTCCGTGIIDTLQERYEAIKRNEEASPDGGDGML